LSDPASTEERSEHEVVVRERRERPSAHDDAHGTDDPGQYASAPEEVFGQLMGVGLVRDGGPLAPGRIRVRGLSGPRVQVNVDHLPLVDPVWGFIDAGSLPVEGLALATSQTGPGFEALGGALRLSRPRRIAGLARARALFGSLDTYRLTGWVDSDGVADGFTAFIDGASTAGDFNTTPEFSPGVVVPEATRKNNDQNRAQGLFTLQAQSPLGQSRVVGWGHVHRGGVPGFTGSPLSDLRGERAFLGTLFRHGIPTAWGDVFFMGHAASTHRASYRSGRSGRSGEEGRDQITTQALHAASSVDTDELPAGLRLQAELSGGWQRALDVAPARGLAGGRISISQPLLQERLRWRLTGGSRWFSDVGMLFSGQADIGYRLADNWRVSVALGHAQRAPTLGEMHAPQGFVLGNPDLKPERSTEGEVGLVFSPHPIIEVGNTVFLGRLDETILFTNRNAFEIQATNTGPLWRSGWEGKVSVNPHPLVGIASVWSTLWSRLDATGAPLPTAPAWTTRHIVRVGSESKVHVLGVLRGQAETSSNLFGTLVAPAYAMVDGNLVWPVSRHLVLSAAATNLFDVTHARDVHQLPLPGRLFFLSLQVEA
jgi:outer membrane receptor protein involved in Fe transport